jgi:DNA-binding FadR family transcriptional regulator
MSISNSKTKWSNHRTAQLADQVVEEVRDMLAEGVIKPGARLPNERALSSQLGVNLTAIRKGLHLLKAMGVIESRVSAVLYDVRRATVARVCDLRSSVEMHRKIYGAVRSGDAEQARAAMTEHLLRAEEDICRQDVRP